MKPDKFVNNHKRAIIFGTICCAVVLILGFGYLSLTNYFTGRIYPFVKIAGVKTGGYKLEQVGQKLKKTYSPYRPVTLIFDDNIINVSQNEIGLKIEIDKAITEAYQSGRTTDFDREINLQASIDEKKLADYLKTKFKGSVVESQDAKFRLNDEKLSVESDKPGQDFDTKDISRDIKKLALTKEPIMIFLVLSSKEAKVKTADLENILGKVDNEINRKLVINIDGKKYSPSKADILSFIALDSNSDPIIYSFRKEDVKTYTEKLARKTDINPKNDVYYSTGELSEQGFDGKKINLDTATEKIYQALKNNEDSVILESETVSKGKKTIEKPFTPGMYPGKYIEVDLSSQRLYQFEGDRLVGEKVVSTGKWSMPTPVGTFSINSKNPRAYSSTYDLYMPYWMAFIGSKYGLHELPEWANGKKEGQDHLGRPVSHGCIRMGVGDAEQVFNWAEIGTQVVIHK